MKRNVTAGPTVCSATNSTARPVGRVYSDRRARARTARAGGLTLSVRGTLYLLVIEGIFTQGWRPGRAVGESVGGILEMDISDWSERDSIPYLRYQT
jgi:hypothetical protein